MHSFRYLDATTTVTPTAPSEAGAALIELHKALVRSPKRRHRMAVGDLLVFANQDGLHSRDRIEITDPVRARTRWLLKTYAFRDRAVADRFVGRWHREIPGLIAD